MELNHPHFLFKIGEKVPLRQLFPEKMLVNGTDMDTSLNTTLLTSLRQVSVIIYPYNQQFLPSPIHIMQPFQ